jgi:hypothetical protein
MAKRKKTDIVGLMVRLRESLRKQIETAAARNEVSLNGEIIARLEKSFREDVSQNMAEILVEQSKQLTALMLAVQAIRGEKEPKLPVPEPHKMENES